MTMAEGSLSTTLDSSIWFDVTAEQLASGAAEATFPFSADVNESIRARRLALDGALFFDELLILAGLGDAADNFPPSTPADLASLLAEIDRCDGWEQLRRDCLCYYLLKFWREEDGENRAARYRSSKLIPQGFAILADAYFHLDEGDSESAVLCLTDMRVQPDFVPKIMQTLSLSAAPSLVLRFVRLAKPPLTDQASLEIYVGALCSVNVVEALLYTRNFPESSDETAQRPRLTGMILNSCLMPKPRPDALNILLSFPLTAYEQVVLNTYALRPPPSLPESSLAILQDLIIVRLIHQGRYSDAITLDKLFVAEAARIGRAGPGIGAVNKAAEARREMFQEILDVLPAIQRKLLDVSLDEQSSQPSATAAVPTIPKGDTAMADMTMSWEELGQSTYTLASSVGSHQGARTPRAAAIPQTPLSASIAFRTARNPKVAVLRAFAHARPSTPTLGDSTSAGASHGAMLEGSPAPGARPSYLAQSASSMLGESANGFQAPSSPFGVTSPFASRPRLSFTPIRQHAQPSKLSASTSNTGRRHPLQESFSSAAFFGDASSGGNTPAGSPSPAPREFFSNGKTSHSDKWSTSRHTDARGGSSTSVRREESKIPPSASWGSSVFGPKKSTVHPPLPPPTDNIADPDRIFKPSRNLLRTPYVPSTARYEAKSSTSNVPPVPQMPSKLFSQSTFTPTKKRGREEMQDLWQGDGTADDRIEFVVSSDDEQEPIRPRRARRRSTDLVQYNNRITNVSMEQSTYDANDATMEEADAMEAEELIQDHFSADDDDAADDDEAEAEAELLKADSGSELPGAFPHDVSRSSAEPSGDEQSSRRRSRRRDSDNRPITSSWVGADTEPEMREVHESRPSRAKPVSTDSQGKKGKTTSTKPISQTSSKPTSSRRPVSTRSTRASSVVSDAPTEEAEPDDEPATAKPTTRSSTLRRSSRLSATPAPSDAHEAPKAKKLRASQSPPRETKRKGRSRSSSANPPASGSSLRLTRRQGPALESLEE